MALIYAEDFAGIGAQGLGGGVFSGYVNDATGLLAMQRLVNGYGFELPAYQTLSGNQWINTVNYEQAKKALMLNMYPATSYAFSPPGSAIGLQRTFNYTGDTVRFGFCVTLVTNYIPKGPFVIFEDMFSVGVDSATGNYMLNDVVTDTTAVFGIDTQMFHEVVFTPTKMELWISKTKIAEVSRSPTPIRKVRFGPTGASLLNFFALYLHSLIVVDNTGTFTGPIGRKLAKTFPATAQGTIQSTVTPAGNTALAVINKIADGKDVEAGAYILGVLASPNGYVTNGFTGVKDAKVPLAACINIQARRKSPAADGLAPFPYIKIGATKVSATPPPVSSLWNVYSVEIPIVPSQTFTTFEFGYDQDFLDVDRVFITNRDGVAVYGNPTATWALAGSDFTAKVPAIVRADVNNAQFNAYISDYAKSTLTLDMKVADNLTYSQDQ